MVVKDATALGGQVYLPAAPPSFTRYPAEWKPARLYASSIYPRAQAD